MRVRFAILGIVFLSGAVIPLACEEFEPSETSSGDAGPDRTATADTGSTSDSSAEPDAAPIVDAAADAPVRTVACGPETCMLPNEVCCIFYGGTPQVPYRFCAVGSCPLKSPNDAGHTNGTAVSCDDPTDCEMPGNVCCAASASTCSTATLTVVECRAPGNCATCAADDAGVGHHFCRPTVTTDCPTDAGCSGTLVPDRFGDYRYCK